MAEIFPNTRVRRSPFYESTIAEGATMFSTYNRMLYPLCYGDPEREYWHLINGVQLWDVAVERQVQLKGPGAAGLAQSLCTRDLSNCRVNQGKYVSICNHRGTIINDPIVLKLDDDLWWLSIADSNIEFWASCVAGERGLDVEVSEPDVSPLAVQGPKADDVVAAIFGDWTRSLRFFWFREAEIEGIPLIVARSGWSRQGGFEIYLRDGRRGKDLWNIVKEAGNPWDIAPGYPNPIERVESGLLSWGGDTDDETSPFEVRLGKYVDLDLPDDVVGIEALRRIHDEGPRRHQLGLILDGDQPEAPQGCRYDVVSGGQVIGAMTSGIWSFRLGRNIGYVLINREFAPGQRVSVMRNDNPVEGELVELPFV